MKLTRSSDGGSYRIRDWCGLLFAMALIPCTAAAQETATETGDASPAQPPPAEEEIIELPPFQVSPAEGWFAQDTFSGTRLRTPYKDLANQIETVTPDFMEDFALNNVEEATIYTINVESREEYVVGEGYDNSLDAGLRLRGLEGVELTRMFFLTFMPADSYNHGRVDISSGPNSILSATRGHAGSINADPNPAVFTNGGHFGAQFDSFGSMRFELNLNQVLVEDVLAIRAALLYADGEYEIEPSSYQDKRFYATATWKPFPKTEVRAYYEYADLYRNKPPRSVPFDRILTWNEASTLPDSGYTEDRPIFQNDLAWQEAGRPTGPRRVFYKADSQKWDTPIQAATTGVGTGAPTISSWFNSVYSYPLHGWPHIPLLGNASFTLLDDKYFPTDINVGGDTRFQDSTDNLFNLVFNQQIAEGFFLELAGQTERLTSIDAFGFGRVETIWFDGNAYLPDGVTPNPNVGQYFVQGTPYYDDAILKADQARITLSYEYDFERKHDSWMHWLGRHRLVGFGSAERSEQRYQRRFYRVVPEVLPTGALQFPTIEGISYEQTTWLTGFSNNRLNFRSYLDPSTGRFSASLPFSVGEPAHLVDSAGNPFTMDPENTGFLTDSGHRLTTASWPGVPQFSGQMKENSYSFTYQGYFWSDRIVATYGTRRNDFDGAPISTELDFYSAMYIHQDDNGFEENQFANNGSAQIIGIVVAPFREWVDFPKQADLSFYYQDSSSYDPVGVRHDPYGNRYPGTHGEGEDMGFRISLAGERFSIRFNRYTVSKKFENAGFPYNGLIGAMRPIEQRVRELDPSIEVLEDIPGRGFADEENLGHPHFEYNVMSDSVSTGYEISGHWIANENLEFRFNAADLEVERSNIGVEWWRWMDERLPTYQSLDVPEGGVDDPRDMDGDGEIGRWTWDTAWLNENDDEDPEKTLSESWENDAIKGPNGRELIQSLEGESNPFIRDLRFNINGMYRFTEGTLRGLQLGAAVRWREAPLLSHGETTVNGNSALDINERHYGVSEWYLDLVARYAFEASWLGDRTTTVSLNVRNALDKDDLVPYLTNVNGDPVRMARVEGIKFILSFKLDL